jgi:hypothetical protein
MPAGSIRKLSARFGGRTPELKQALVAGAAANTNIAVSGIQTRDQLVGVFEIPASAAATDRTAATSVTSAGNIQVTASTAGNQLLVTYWSV